MKQISRAVTSLGLGLVLVVGCGGDSKSDDDGVADDSPADDTPTDDTPADDGTFDAPTPDATVCSASTSTGLTDCVEPARYQTDLESVAKVRVPTTAAWQEVQDLCSDRLTELGYTVELHDYGTGVNVIGVKLGTTEPDQRILVGAHYDHIAGCVGADDNATGVAATLEMARVLSLASYPKTLVVACWDEEERGLIGSNAYATRATMNAEQIVAYFNFEMIGYVSEEPNSQSLPSGFGILFPDAVDEVNANDKKGNFIAVIGDTGSAAHQAVMETHADRLGLPFIDMTVPDNLLLNPATADLRRSDHAPFWREGVPAMLITDTSNFRYEAYHCTNGTDAVANLNRDFSANVVRVTVGAAAAALGLD